MCFLVFKFAVGPVFSFSSFPPTAFFIYVSLAAQANRKCTKMISTMEVLHPIH